MSFIEDYVLNVEDRTLPFLRSHLADIESGDLTLCESRANSAWVDTTPEYARRLKETIAEYEDIVAKLKAGEVP